MKKREKAFARDSAFRFTLPVIGENLLTSSVGLIYSSILGGVSASSLAAAGTGNQAMNFIVSFFSAIVTGSAILLSRLTGQGDKRQASRMVEQAMLMAPVISLIVTVILFAFSAPFTKLIMPGASDEFLHEGLRYLRAVLLSLPGLIVYNTMSGILRAAGDSKFALFGAVITNIVQLISAYIFINVLHMEVLGAGLAYVVCRYAGAVTLCLAVLHHHRNFIVNKKNIFHPDKRECMRILKIGAPNTVDSLAVHGGYLLINTLLIGLGQQEASVYNVLATLITFTGICQGIVSASTTTLVGHKIGAGEIQNARRLHTKIVSTGLAATCLLCTLVMCFPSFFTGLFTKDALVHKESASLAWVLITFCLPAVAVNSAEPGARVGGEAKAVMISCIANVWLVRLPLTYLFCYPLHMGVMGVFLANSIACLIRAVISILLISGKRWGTKEL